MTIKGTEGPSQGLDVVRQALKHLSPRTTKRLSEALTLGGAQAAQPIPLYVIGLDEIQDDNFLSAASMAGWRYMLVNDDPVAAADVDVSENNTVGFSRLIHSTHAASLLKASQKADKEYGKAAMEYEPRILEVPSLYLSALWLHGEEDHFFPYASGEAGAMQSMSEDRDFVTKVCKQAENKRQLRDELRLLDDAVARTRTRDPYAGA